MTRLTISAYREKYKIQKEIDRKRLELLEIQTDLTGLSHHGQDLSPEQEKSSKPMPTTVSPIYSDSKRLALIERKDELEREVDYLYASKSLADRVERLSLEDQRMMHELYHSNKTAERVAADAGYSTRGMYKRIYSVLDQLA